MPGYLNPKNDIPFKRIFGEHAHLLISFLNALLPLEEGRQIVEVTPLLPGQKLDTLLGSRPVVNVMCRDSTNQSFAVEMELYWSPAFTEFRLDGSRALMTHKILEGFQKKKPFNPMQPVYSLAIVVEEFEPKDGERWYYHYQAADVDNPTCILEGVELIIVDLENFQPDRPGVADWTADKQRMAVLWLRFLKEMGNESTPAPDLFEQEEIEEALKICEKDTYSPSHIVSYEKYWDHARWERTMLMVGRKAEKGLALLAEIDKKNAEIEALKRQIDELEKT
jgi:hypothetical protein